MYSLTLVEVARHWALASGHYYLSPQPDSHHSAAPADSATCGSGAPADVKSQRRGGGKREAAAAATCAGSASCSWRQAATQLALALALGAGSDRPPGPRCLCLRRAAKTRPPIPQRQRNCPVAASGLGRARALRPRVVGNQSCTFCSHGGSAAARVAALRLLAPTCCRRRWCRAATGSAAYATGRRRFLSLASGQGTRRVAVRCASLCPGR